MGGRSNASSPFSKVSPRTVTSGARRGDSDRLLIAMLDHLKPVAYDARKGAARPADPGIAYAAAVAACATAIDTGAEPQVPLMEDDGRRRPVMTRAEFIAAIRMRPRLPAEGEEDKWGPPRGRRRGRGRGRDRGRRK